MIELSKDEYNRVLPLLKNLAFEPVFAYSVIDNNQAGKVFVDHSVNPASILIIHSYGQYLLAGNGENKRFMDDVVEFLMNDQNHSNYYDLFATTTELLFQISGRLAGRSVLLNRSFFTFDLSKFHDLKTINTFPINLY
ncbi:hypothetical protein EHS13_02650 [Paenibacillus psychroresistens]|uniref:Uncharacterized protein n=1 Tax=Paenibacillus psychroresistens TaxID=1778678 RepID=A0A6B8REE7_9BACL|nr:hypothetical protein [Paenibacillus psychroresistens]QGQ93883.1 hypothetical protein EHS13_02650 [Paenibacillus psychroresistens]